MLNVLTYEFQNKKTTKENLFNWCCGSRHLLSRCLRGEAGESFPGAILPGTVRLCLKRDKDVGQGPRYFPEYGMALNPDRARASLERHPVHSKQ